MHGGNEANYREGDGLASLPRENFSSLGVEGHKIPIFLKV